MSELQAIGMRARVGIIPYLKTPYTQGVFPLKLYEYLGCGLRVIATNLPALKDVQSADVAVAPTPAAFINEVVAAVDIAATPSVIERRWDEGYRNSWLARGHLARAYVASKGGANALGKQVVSSLAPNGFVPWR